MTTYDSCQWGLALWPGPSYIGEAAQRNWERDNGRRDRDMRRERREALGLLAARGGVAVCQEISTHGTLNKLESEGLIEIMRADRPGRPNTCFITEAGRKLLSGK